MDITLDNINDIGYMLLLCQVLNATPYEVENGLWDCVADYGDDDDDYDWDLD